MRQHNAEIRQREFATAQIAAAIYNTGFKSPKDPVKVEDLMPSAQPQRSAWKLPREKREPQVVAAEIENVLAMWKPKVVNKPSTPPPLV